MLRSSNSDRGQTEPIAALFAVTIIAMALSIYGAAMMDLLPGQSERGGEHVAMEKLWQDIKDDGVYEPGTLGNPDEIERSSLGKGQNVYVNVTYLDGGGWTEDGPYVYDHQGNQYSDVDRIPDRATVASRPISVRTDHGVIQTGQLYVAVWQR